jgi:NAD(P)-dependent dehydrogenase (short-subunit alcohol dehydrogenase family)
MAQTSLDGGVVIVTGAGRGIGREVARVLAGEGATVVVASRTQSDLDKLVHELATRGLRAAARVCDVSRAAEVRALVRWTCQRFGIPDAVICSHGVAVERPFLELAEHEWEETLAVNLTGCFLLGQEAARAMVTAGRPGRIVFISSINALGSEPRVADYSASKAGLHGLMRSMALELGARGITVNAVAPGWVRTPMTEPFLTDELLSGQHAVNPVRRIGEPEDIARAVAWLIHPSSSYMNGSVVVVDGGQTAMLPFPTSSEFG